MIIRDDPRLFQLFFVVQGSIIARIRNVIVGVVLFTGLIYLCDRMIISLPHISLAAMSVFGIALSLFHGFRNNAAYERWWEARKLWGQLVADFRNLGRETALFIGDETVRRAVLHRGVAFAHLHRGVLRGVGAGDALGQWVPADRIDALAGAASPACAALEDMTAMVRRAYQAGQVNDFGLRALAARFAAIGMAQAGCERIAATPLPFVYSLLVRRTTYLYCVLVPFALIESVGILAPVTAGIIAYVFFGLAAVTEELEHPFRPGPNSLPLDAMCRMIEISIAQTLGDPIPPRLEPQDYVLS